MLVGRHSVASSDKGVAAILIGDDPDALARDLQDRFPHAHLVGGDTAYEKLVAQVVGFVETPSVGLDLPLDIRGTAFQQRVWQALREIPAGKTASYADVAAGWVRPSRPAPLPRLARPMVWPSRFPAIAWSVATARFRAIAGAWSASAH